MMRFLPQPSDHRSRVYARTIPAQFKMQMHSARVSGLPDISDHLPFFHIPSCDSVYACAPAYSGSIWPDPAKRLRWQYFAV